MAESGKWKLLIATPDEAEVFLLKSRLESEGINCRIDRQNRYPENSQAGKSPEYRAYVPVKDFEASQQVLEEEDREE